MQSIPLKMHFYMGAINETFMLIIGTLRYEDGKARTGTAVDAGNFRGSRCVVKNKMLKMRIFSDGDVNNSNFVKAIPFTETVTSFRL